MRLVYSTSLFVALAAATAAPLITEDLAPSDDARFAHLNLAHPHARIYIPGANDTKDSIPEPDPRFAHIDPGHPNARIYVPNATEIAKRDIGPGTSGHGYYECSQSFFRGDCQWIELDRDTNACRNARFWPLGSMGPDKDVHCTIYEDYNCQPQKPHKADYAWPGTGDCPNYKWFGAWFTLCPQSWTCAVDG